MSDSDDDFGGFDPTTPIQPSRQRKQKYKPASRVEAGPSKSHAQQQVATRRSAKPVSETRDGPVEVDNDDGDGEDEDEIQEVQRLPPKPVRPPSRAPAAKGKGKAKAKPARKAVEVDADVMDVDVSDTNEKAKSKGDTRDKEVVEEFNSSINAAMQPHREMPSHRTKREQHLENQLRQAQARNASLAAQLQEALQIRETEVEAVMRREAEQSKAQNQALEALVKSLTDRLSQQDPLMRSGKSSILHLVTREAADEEMRNLEKEKNAWKDKSESLAKQMEKKDAEIAELRLSESLLQKELKAEIQRNKSLNSKSARGMSATPQSQVRVGITRALGSDDPRIMKVIAMYEDLTNLLVTGAKMQPGNYLDLDEWVYTCVYTFAAENDSDKTASLTFSLRICNDLAPDSSEPVTSKSQLVENIHYLPLELDKEAPDFVTKLGFLNQPFMFGKDQLSIFLRTLNDNVVEVLKDGDQELDDEIQEVES